MFLGIQEFVAEPPQKHNSLLQVQLLIKPSGSRSCSL